MTAGLTRRRPGELPVEVTGFVGRRAELAMVDGWLRSARLVTVTGPGGVGKTRVAPLRAEGGVGAPDQQPADGARGDLRPGTAAAGPRTGGRPGQPRRRGGAVRAASGGGHAGLRRHRGQPR